MSSQNQSILKAGYKFLQLSFILIVLTYFTHTAIELQGIADD